MEECEALCTRIAIMVNGRFKCLGSTQTLKSKFGQGYTVMARLTPGPDLDVRTLALQNWFARKFPGCGVKDSHHGYVLYHVPSATHTWAQVFASMERASHQHGLEDYSVGQTTLEQVFLYFTRAQRLGEDGSPSCMAAMVQNCCKLCGRHKPPSEETQDMATIQTTVV